MIRLLIMFIMLASPAIGAASNLSGLGITALNSDVRGVARGTSWDIGAYRWYPYSSSLSGSLTLSGGVVVQ